MTNFYNFLPVRKGGGLQNSRSFLEVVSDSNGVLVLNSALSGGGYTTKFSEVMLSSGGGWGRLIAELRVALRSSVGDRCFTLFGPPPMLGCGKAVNVVGCAYSNLFYPELDFWSDYSGISKFKKLLVDGIRKFCLSRADYWIFETDILARRAVELFSFPEDRVFVVRMAPSKLVTHSEDDTDTVSRFLSLRHSGSFRLLYLSGAHPNKRIDRLFAVAERLKELGDSRIKFVLTFDASTRYARFLCDEITRRGIDDFFINVGTVRPDNVAALITSCSAMCNFSRLESFSNNFVEAWAMHVPLLVTDADWSRDSCGEAAIYVVPTSPSSIIDGLNSIVDNPDARAALAESGQRVLDSYPDAEKKGASYMRIFNMPGLNRYRGRWVWRKKLR